MTPPTVLITGAGGFVGGETVLAFKDINWQVIAVDHQCFPEHLTGVADVEFCQDFTAPEVLESILEYRPTSIVHCAAKSLVGPSMMSPAQYYEHNVVRVKNLLDFLVDHKINTRLIVSSSSSVYGDQNVTSFTEDVAPKPMSPYGESKRMMEMILASYHDAYGLDYTALRYFNVVGADSQVRHGQRPNATHIIARVLESLRDDKEFVLNGNDYATPDGTCIRDHVHVEDVANAHVMASFPEMVGGVYNVGQELGASNLEVIRIAEQVTGRRLHYRVSACRPGDPARLVANTQRLRSQGWQPQYLLTEMIEHAWRWYIR